MSLLMWPGCLGKTKKDKRSPHESRILTNRVRETLHSATSKNECAEPPCAHVYARVHWLNFTAKHVRTVIRWRFGTYLWQIDGSLATQTIEIHRVARSVSSLRSVWVSALRCALREYFTRPSFAWQYLPKESTVEEWVEIRGGYRLPIRFEGGSCESVGRGRGIPRGSQMLLQSIKQGARSNPTVISISDLLQPTPWSGLKVTDTVLPAL